MKTLTIVFILLITLCINAQNNTAKRFAVKSGFVSYNLTGNTTGTRTLYWDDYGEKTFEEVKSTTEIKMFGMKSKEETHIITIMVGDKFWTINKLDNTGQKGTIDTHDMSKTIAKEMSETEAKKLEQDILDALNGKRLGTEEFLGKKCEVIEVMGAKSWIYKGVVLKLTANVMGVEGNETAVEFKENIAITESKFVPNKNIEYKDIDQMKESMFGEF